MVRHAEPNRVLPAGDGIEDMRLAAQDQGEWTRPEGVCERPGDRRHVKRPVVDEPSVGEVHDHRVVDRATLRRKDPGQRIGRGRVGAQPIDRLGGQSDEPSLTQQLGGCGDPRRVAVEEKRLVDAVER